MTPLLLGMSLCDLGAVKGTAGVRLEGRTEAVILPPLIVRQPIAVVGTKRTKRATPTMTRIHVSRSLPSTSGLLPTCQLT